MSDRYVREKVLQLEAENKALCAELAGIGRCGAHRVATGDQCLRENDHYGEHIFERETADALALLRALEGEVIAESEGWWWCGDRDEVDTWYCADTPYPRSRRARLVAAEPPEENP